MIRNSTNCYITCCWQLIILFYDFRSSISMTRSIVNIQSNGLVPNQRPEHDTLVMLDMNGFLVLRYNLLSCLCNSINIKLVFLLNKLTNVALTTIPVLPNQESESNRQGSVLELELVVLVRTTNILVFLIKKV